jgi:hypothetical protein
MVDNVLGIMQQLVAVSIFILVLYLVQEWISKSQQNDKFPRIISEKLNHYMCKLGNILWSF